MPTYRSLLRYTVITAIAVLAFVATGCESTSGPGKRIKDGFDASKNAKTASYKATIKADLPAMMSGGSNDAFSINFDGDVDTNGTEDFGDDSSRMNMSFTGVSQKLRIIMLDDKIYYSTRGKALGGPATSSVSDKDWEQFLDATMNAATDLKEADSTTVAGAKLDVFSATMPKDAVCNKLVPLFEKLGDTGSSTLKGAGDTCQKGLKGPLALRIGIDDKDWPRLIEARGRLDFSAMLKMMGGADPALEGMPKLDVALTARFEVTQYNGSIPPIEAPENAKMFDSEKSLDDALFRTMK